MRLFLVLLAAVAALLGAGWYLVSLGHGTELLGGAGALLLLLAAVLPRRKPKCGGFHCSGCTHH